MANSNEFNELFIKAKSFFDSYTNESKSKFSGVVNLLKEKGFILVEYSKFNDLLNNKFKNEQNDTQHINGVSEIVEKIKKVFENHDLGIFAAVLPSRTILNYDLIIINKISAFLTMLCGVILVKNDFKNIEKLVISKKNVSQQFLLESLVAYELIISEELFKSIINDNSASNTKLTELNELIDVPKDIVALRKVNYEK